jgi:hypothetical protein
MDTSSDGRHVIGAFRIVAELGAVAAEFAAAGVWADELTARRRLRDDPREAIGAARSDAKAL